MASQSEIFLADSTGEALTAKSGKARTRRKSSPKSAKKAAPRASSKPANENKAAESDVVPMMKLRSIDVVGDGEQEDGSPVKKIPATSLSSAIAANGIDETDGAGTNGNGSEHPDGTEKADAVTDPELLELLEQLSVTIDSANNVLEAAVTAPGEAPATAPSEAISSPALKPEPAPEPDEEPDDPPPPLAAQFATLSPAPQPPMDHKQKRGFNKVTTAVITGLALTAGVGWLLYTNPWLMDDGSKAATVSDTTARATLNERSAPALANVAPAAVPMAARPETARVLPPVQNQPIAAPRVSFGQPVAGNIGQPVALAINLPAGARQTEMSIMIQGVPEKTQLSAGKSLGNGNWLLSETELQGLTLNAAASFVPARFNLDVILVRSDGKVPEVHKLPVAIGPAPVVVARTPVNGAAPPRSATTYVQSGITLAVPVAPAPVAPVPIAVKLPPAVKSKVAVIAAPKLVAPTIQTPPAVTSAPLPTLTRQEVSALMARANTLLEQGDVAGARLLLEYAAQHGSKRAMLRMGETFDPDHLSRLGVHGVKPDQDQAALWYDRAAKAVAAQ